MEMSMTHIYKNTLSCVITLVIEIICFSCSKSEDIITKNESLLPKLSSFVFTMESNSLKLIKDVHGEIIGDSIVEVWIDHVLPDKNFIANFNYLGDSITYNNALVESGKTLIDYSKPISLKVHSNNFVKEYEVMVSSFTGLPVIWIETENRSSIDSKEVYLNAHMRLVENAITRSAGEITEADLQIKGHGNSTWWAIKKPYRLKFKYKVSLFNEKEDKSWILLANYYDKTMLRNHIAFYLGSLSDLEYTSSSHFCELMLNGRYMGTYQLAEKTKISKYRIQAGNDGYYLEVDNKLQEGEVNFTTPHLPKPVRIHEPDVVEGDDNYEYIKNYILRAENVLFSEDFLDEDKGYKQLYDIYSFADWYVISEIVENASAPVNWNMSLSKGGKIKMGPLWDYDLSLGNAPWGETATNPKILWLKDVEWISRMMEDPEFITLIKSRFNYFYSKKQDLYYYINQSAKYLEKSVIENENRWHLLYNVPFSDAPNSLNIWGCYSNEVQYLKDWLNTRLEWLKVKFNDL